MNFGASIRLNKYGLSLILFIILIYTLHLVSKDSKGSSGGKINLRTLLNVGIKAAENGGKKVVESKDHMNVMSKGLTKEGLQDSVTNADYLSHCSMTNTINHFFPSINLISEESVNCKEDKSTDYTIKDFIPNIFEQTYNEDDVTVWIDPLDATHEYTEKLYKYVTTMVCVAVKGKPVIGIIHKPFENTTSWAWVDIGRSKDLNTQENGKNGNSLKVIVSLSHKGEIESVLQKNFDKKVEIVSAAGAGYKALEVAKGHVDAYLHITAIKKWDICAGNAIINALGGRMLNKFGDELIYSKNGEVVNEKGLIASLNQYKEFVNKLDIEI